MDFLTHKVCCLLTVFFQVNILMEAVKYGIFSTS